MDIIHDYTAHDGNYTPGGNRCRYIVVHNTGNSASANAEARYAQNSQHPSSYHYVLDGLECYQLLDDTDTAWAVGAWSGARQIIANSESISIEVASDGEEFSDAEQRQLRDLVAMLMERHSIDADHVVRHYDCHTGHKDCPAYYAGSGNKAWDNLHDYITGGTVSEYGWQQDDGGWWYKWWQPDGGYTYPRDEWQYIDDAWYRFDPEGYTICGDWYVDDAGTWYRLDGDGHMLTGWQEIDGHCYYFDSDGRMQTGWLERDDGTYWLWPDDEGEHVLGAMATGWQKPEGTYAYFDESGAMARDIIKRIDGKWYIFEPGGSLVEGTFSTDENGALQL